jgi:hypothetical protein
MTHPSERELKKELDELGGGDLEPLTLAEVISYETETIDEKRGIVRVVETGELRKQGSVPDNLDLEALS